MQRFVSDAPWEDAKIRCKYRYMVSEDFVSPDGSLIFDESGFVKKGDESIGMARQYCGYLGNVDNCQVGVFSAYVSEHGYTLVDKRLFLPEKWFTENYAKPREKCNLSADAVYKNKPELAAEMLLALRVESLLPFNKYILADSVYGMSPEFVEAAEVLEDTTYLVQVTKASKVWLKRPMTISRTYQLYGKTWAKEIVIDVDSKTISDGELASSINNYFWYRGKVSEGIKWPITYEFTWQRVRLSAEGLPKKAIWPVICRTLGDNPEYIYFIGNAWRAVRLDTLVWFSGLLWAIEQCFEETKTELGMDHYEVRKYAGWHHNILTRMSARFFRGHLKIRMEGKKYRTFRCRSLECFSSYCCQ